MTVYDELSSVLKLKYKPGVDIQGFLQKVVTKANDLSDKEWDKLTPETQNWINDAVEAHDSGEDIPVPSGLEDDDDAEEDELSDIEVDEDEDEPEEDDDVDDDEDDNVIDTADEDDEDDDDEEEEEAPRARRVAKNGKAGKASTKKTAKPEKEVKPAKKAKAKPAKEEKPVKAKGKVKAAKAEKPAKVAKPIKGKAKAEKKARAGGGGRGRASRFKDDQVITVLVPENPKRPGSSSHARFELYSRGKKGMTVAEAKAKGVTAADLSWDVGHGFIKIE